MDEMTRLQRRWIDAARRRQAPPADAVRRMRRGLRARIEAGEPAPALLSEDAGGPAPGPHLRPWLLGGAGLLAAAALLLWASSDSASRLSRADDPNAARYDARGQAGAVAPRRAASPSSNASTSAPKPAPLPAPAPAPTPDSAIASPSVVQPPAAPTARTKSDRGAESKRVPSTSSPSAIPSDPSARTPAALDVAGEAAVLRRVKVALERKAWARADAVLDEYAQAHPEGILAPEARALRVEVACRRESPDASDRAARFLQRNPTSPLRDRIRGACGIDP